MSSPVPPALVGIDYALWELRRDAHDLLKGAMLRLLSAEHFNDVAPDRMAPDEYEYAQEQVELAAARLTKIINRMDPEYKPVGWDKAHE